MYSTICTQSLMRRPNILEPYAAPCTMYNIYYLEFGNEALRVAVNGCNRMDTVVLLMTNSC